MPRKFLIQSATFCYVCGEMTLKSQRRNFTRLIKKCYELYFGCKVGDKDTSCVTCVRLLIWCVNGSRRMPFAVPVVWRETKDRLFDCYFCSTNITGITSKSKHIVKYPDLPSAMRPVPHSEQLLVPEPTEIWIIAITTLILMKKFTDSKKGTMLIAIRHFKQVVPHLSTIC